MEKHSFTFAILQYRHDVWSGEAMNVGVLLASPELGYLDFQRGRFWEGSRRPILALIGSRCAESLKVSSDTFQIAPHSHRFFWMIKAQRTLP